MNNPPMTPEEEARLTVLENTIDDKLNDLALIPAHQFEQVALSFKQQSPFDAEITDMVIWIARQRQSKKAKGN